MLLWWIFLQWRPAALWTAAIRLMGEDALPTKWAILPTSWSNLWRLRCVLDLATVAVDDLVVVDIIFDDDDNTDRFKVEWHTNVKNGRCTRRPLRAALGVGRCGRRCDRTALGQTVAGGCAPPNNNQTNRRKKGKKKTRKKNVY